MIASDLFSKEEIAALKGYLLHNLNLMPNSMDLYAHAFLHSSKTSGLSDCKHLSNERLEFLGDSILNMWTTYELYHRYLNVAEGVLSKRKSVLVSAPVLSEVCRTLGLEDYLNLSDADFKIGSQHRESIQANLVEALIGAISLDSDMDMAHDFLQKHIYPHWEKWLKSTELINYKSLLLEYTQSQEYSFSEYKLVSESGPDHLKEFTIEAWLNNTLEGVGVGSSKKRAEQKAAQEVCAKLGLNA
jgi:ribonuclease-3